jgi:hypothetical protein
VAVVVVVVVVVVAAAAAAAAVVVVVVAVVVVVVAVVVVVVAMAAAAAVVAVVFVMYSRRPQRWHSWLPLCNWLTAHYNTQIFPGNAKVDGRWLHVVQPQLRRRQLFLFGGEPCRRGVGERVDRPCVRKTRPRVRFVSAWIQSILFICIV